MREEGIETRGATALEAPTEETSETRAAARAPSAVRVPRTLEVAAAVSWRLLVVAAAVLASVLLLARLQVVLVATAGALLVSCALWPGARRLRSIGASPLTAALTMMVALLGSLALAVAVVAPYAADDVGELDVNVSEGLNVVQSWLTQGPLYLSEAQVESFFERAEAQVRAAGNRAVRGAWDGAVVAIEIVAGLLLAIMLTFFFLKDGDRMWRWVLGFVPKRRRDAWNQVVLDVRDVLAGFIRGTTIVAAVDAVGIGVGLYVLNVPLVIPIALLTFLGGFVPLVGATVAGFVAVMVALVSNGFVTALLVLGVVIAVQQLEGNILQPVVVGRIVHLHPVAILLAVGAGAVLWGIIGALLAVPITAALATILEHVRAKPDPDSEIRPDSVLDEPEVEIPGG